MIKILSVAPSSPAFRAGIRPGESIISINDEKIIDEIDYQDLIQHAHLEMDICGIDGKIRRISIAKSSWESLGICLDETTAMKPRHCRNHCVFCFVDQMPPGMRKSLYVKDDDWRLSLMMGNFVTLTNVDDEEFARILRRKASPLYISVHATDGIIRNKMLRNPNADKILDRLTALKNHGLQFHAQIVLCPGINDGIVLEKTLSDLSRLYPSALSVAIVPLGITRFREKLPSLPTVHPEMARNLICMIQNYQDRYLHELGTRFVYLSDEFYCLCGLEPPEEDCYEGFPQIENGVGLIRQFEEECADAYRELKQLPEGRRLQHSAGRIVIPTGVSVKPHIEKLCRMYAPDSVQINVIPVLNTFFGTSITVTGLIVGQDLIRTLKDKEFDLVLISESMLRENTNRFLDDITLNEVQEAIGGKPIRIVQNNGESFIRAIWQMEEKYE